MDVLLHRYGGHGSLRVPDGLPQLVCDISREVLRKQPSNLYCFIADYLESLLTTEEASRAMCDMMTDFFAELGGGETAASGTGPSGELDLKGADQQQQQQQQLQAEGWPQQAQEPAALQTRCRRPPQQQQQQQQQQQGHGHEGGEAASEREERERAASPPSEPPRGPSNSSPLLDEYGSYGYGPGDVPLGVPLLGASLGLSLGLGAMLRPPHHLAAAPSAEAAATAADPPPAPPVLTVTSADGTTRQWHGCPAVEAPGATQTEPKARSALTNHPKRAPSVRDPTLQQLLEPGCEALPEPAPGAARAFEKEGAVPKIRPVPVPSPADCEPLVQSPRDGRESGRRHTFVDRDEMDDIGDQLDSILAVNQLGLLSVFEAMTDTSDLADPEGSDSDDTLVGTPTVSPRYSVTFPAEVLVAEQGADVCFHYGGVELDGASRTSDPSVGREGNSDSDDIAARLESRGVTTTPDQCTERSDNNYALY